MDRVGRDSDINQVYEVTKNEAEEVDVHAEENADDVWKDFNMATEIERGRNRR
uniref:Uncharacterized protein n=1 Tax=Hyaloperonospora arabidopsidis (strain Emoy2) TaxID=559515 RepID=M4BRT2_HYAAE